MILDVVNIWRVRNPHARLYTWRQNNPLIQSRPDFWLVSKSMQDFIKDTGIKPALSTDHSLIYFNIENEFINNKHGPSYWKFNNSLCDDIEYSNALHDKALNWFNIYNDIEDNRVLWELIKYI